MAKRKSASPAEVARMLRADARYAEVFNSGLEVWLYDATHRDRLKSSGAFETELETDELERHMRQFVREGLIMAYQLMQDDSLSIAIAVGGPLSEEELAVARWLEPQIAFLRLPSGRLVIESNDALTIRDEEPTDKGAELAVPAGEYLATLYRIDHDALEADEMDWKGPNELIVLTPGAAARPVPDQPAFLAWEPRGPGEAKWTVEAGKYEGVALVHDAATSIEVALDPAGIERLGLRDLGQARLSVPALGIDCVLVYLQGNASDFKFFSRVQTVKPSREHAGGEWAPCWQQPGMNRILGLRENPRGRVPKKQQNAWHPATLTLLPEPAQEKKQKK